MPDDLSIGIEEEFQIVDATTTHLTHGYAELMRAATPAITRAMKAEFLQCVVECITEKCATIDEARQQTLERRATALALARQAGMTLISAGTHPADRWTDQKRSQTDPRYGELEDTLQDVARSILIYGLHVHVNVEDEDRRVLVMNQARTFIPYILALSANSPFWMGRLTGYQSYRTMVWAPFPFAGIPDPFPSGAAYREFRRFFLEVGALREPRRIWWDIRPHHTLPTVEFRIADMPLHFEDMIALAAFIQAIVKTILDRMAAGEPLTVAPTAYVAENRWRAARYGLRGELIDYDRRRTAPATALIGAALDLVSDAAAQLGTSAQIDHLRAMLEPGHQTGAERQIAAYRRRHRVKDVTRLLIEETAWGIDPAQAWPLREAALVGVGANGRHAWP